jgi:Ca2+-binding EF-hand superfamily protein
LCTVFNIYDQDGDGFISMHEMSSYLESAYKLAFADKPDRARMAAEKAQECARSAFQGADTNADGLLSFDEFYRWYREGLNKDNPAAAVVSATSWKSMDEVKRLTNLEEHELEDVIEVFAEGTDGEGCLTLEAFEACITALHEEDEVLNDGDRRQRSLVIQRLFQLFDVDNNGLVDIIEIASGVSVLCDRDQDHHFEIVFSMFDKEAEGFITFQDLETYLVSVFKVLSELENLNGNAAGQDAHTMGSMAAMRVFASAGKDVDEGWISLDEFKSWAHSTKDEVNPKCTSIERLSAGSIEREAGFVDEDALEGLEEHLTFNDARALTHLHERNCSEVFDHFKQYAGSDSALDIREFRMAFYHLLTTNLSGNQLHDFNSFVDNLFSHFDADQSGEVDFRELVAGLSVMCAGSGEDKVRSAFNLYDTNGDGFISFDEMKHYLTSVFKVIFEAQPNVRTSMGGILPSELGVTTAEQVFAEADVNHDGKISFEEFTKWQNTSSWGGADDGGAADATDAAGTGTGTLDYVRNLHDALTYEEVRQLTRLDLFSAEHFFEVLSDSSHDGMLDLNEFVECFLSMVSEYGQAPTDEFEMRSFQQVLERMFAIFDPTGSGEVPFSDIASGLSIMCRGEREDKIQTVFNLFDFNGDGYISFIEMVRYLTAVFRVVYETTPGVEAQTGLTAADLARVTAEQAFEDFDLNQDNQLSFEEFKFWYQSPASGGIGGGGETDDAAAQPAAAASPMYSLGRVRELTNLGSYSIDDVIGVFSDEVQEDGTIDFDGFRAAFDEFREEGVFGDAEFKSVLQRLYLVFLC